MCACMFLGVTFPDGESDEPYDMQFCKWMIKEKVKILVITDVYNDINCLVLVYCSARLKSQGITTALY